MVEGESSDCADKSLFRLFPDLEKYYVWYVDEDPLLGTWVQQWPFSFFSFFLFFFSFSFFPF